MRPDREEIREYIIELLQGLAEDWDYLGSLVPETGIFSDLGLESLDAVILGTTIQEHYKQQMPFAQLLSEVGQKEVPELSIAELVDFVDIHLTAEVGEGK